MINAEDKMTTRKTNPTIHDIRRAAGPNVEVTREPSVYRATCKPGFAFDEGHLHELVAWFGPMEGTAAEARLDLFERLGGNGGSCERAEPCEPCRAGTCDWMDEMPEEGR